MRITEDILREVATEVLESMAFVAVLPVPDEEIAPDMLARACATVKFHGPFEGEILLTVPYTIMADFVNDMLGEDEGEAVSEAAQYDALGELANVICGNLLARMAGPEPIFNLEGPKVVTVFCEQETLRPGNVSARVPLENGWAELCITLDNPALIDQTV